MIKNTLKVTNKEGLHTRPANAFVKTCKGLDVEVTLIKGEMEAPGGSLLKVMKLGIVKDDEVTLVCDGTDEKKALKTLLEIICPEGTGQ